MAEFINYCYKVTSLVPRPSSLTYSLTFFFGERLQVREEGLGLLNIGKQRKELEGKRKASGFVVDMMKSK